MKFCWVTVNVKDMEASLKFYTELVGLPIARRMPPNHGTEIVFLGQGETKVELIRNERIDSPSFGRDIVLGFEVDSVDAKVAELKAKGIDGIEGPFQPIPAIKFIFVEDPNGVRVQFVENL